jgi:flagellar motor switch protein FliG
MAETIREEIEIMPPQRRKDVEEAQTRIVAVARQLEESGDIQIFRGSEADEVV